MATGGPERDAARKGHGCIDKKREDLSEVRGKGHERRREQQTRTAGECLARADDAKPISD